MKGARDAAIKLFGKEITLPENGRTLAFSGEYSAGDCGDKYGWSDHDHSSVMAACLEDKKVSRTGEEQKEQEQLEDDNKDPPAVNPTGSKQQDKSTPPTTKEPGNPGMLPESDENPKTPSGNEETATPKPPKTENDEIDTENPEQKPLKKPDKILPCGRCNSMDTKFCYYNNYNINQPRHFCKSCQRYWTAGGTMRSVPVGAGRRKNKNPALHCRHITISEALQAARMDASNGIHHPAFKTNGTVLSFGPEAPICESMASVLNLAGKKAPNGKFEQGMPIAGNGGENGDDCSSGSSVTTSNSVEEGARNGIQESMMRNFNGFSPQIPCLPGVPWPYPWNSAVPVPAFCPSGYPMPFYPAPYWNCSVPGAWSIPWLFSTSPTENQSAPSSAPNSSTLGKHSRDGDLLKPSNADENEPIEHKNSERSVLIPKTLRTDDTDEAARSSIWAMLGIKNDSIGRRGLLKAFQPKDEEKKHTAETLPALRANPAALSRSLSFQAGA